jgi:mono/diheme cytochrome c family protein
MKHSVALLLVAALTIFLAPALIADGAALYKSNCTICHGADGAGDTPTGKLMKVKPLGSADVQKLTDAQIHSVIKDGKGKMRAFGKKLSDADISLLVAHVRTFAAKK